MGRNGLYGGIGDHHTTTKTFVASARIHHDLDDDLEALFFLCFRVAVATDDVDVEVGAVDVTVVLATLIPFPAATRAMGVTGEVLSAEF